MTDSSGIDVDLLRSWIGREHATATHVDDELVRRFAAIFDEEATDLRPGDVAPRLLHFCLAQPAARMQELSPDGHPARGHFLPPVPLPRRMWAGGQLAFHGDIHLGEAVQRISRIDDVVAKEGRTGTLCFVTVHHEIIANGRPVVVERQDIVYRGLERPGAPQPSPPAAPIGNYQRTVLPSAALLFRYSALTFNSHRIHYDLPYVTKVEGYPGLVVHGPLQATLLLRFATEIHGAPPVRFSFRSQSPLFGDVPFLAHAREESGGLKLWTARPDGPLAMSAEAHW